MHALQREFLRPLTDDDLEVLEAVLSVREEGGDEPLIPAATLARQDKLKAAWERFLAEPIGTGTNESLRQRDWRFWGPALATSCVLIANRISRLVLG